MWRSQVTISFASWILGSLVLYLFAIFVLMSTEHPFPFGAIVMMHLQCNALWIALVVVWSLLNFFLVDDIIINMFTYWSAGWWISFCKVFWNFRLLSFVLFCLRRQVLKQLMLVYFCFACLLFCICIILVSLKFKIK